MTKTLRLIFLIALVVFVLPAAFAKDAPTSAEQLRSELETAAKSKDTNAIIAHFNWTGVSGDMKEMLLEMPGYITKDDIATVKLSPVPTGFQPTNELSGIRYFPNLPVIGIVEFESTKKGNSWQLPYGESNGNFYLIGTAQETLDPKAKKENGFGILVIGLSANNPVIVNGGYTYLKAGKEITVTVSFTNTGTYGFYGDHIKSCKFTKNSGEGSIALIITKEANKIFDSGMITNNSVTYEGKQ